MTERPILFSGAMVRAIRMGCKTQTRRIIKPTERGCSVGAYVRDDGHAEPVNIEPDGDPGTDIRCPYGVPGDRLWVRETFYHDGDGSVLYRADDPDLGFAGRWRPSIFMPRDACRLVLEVVSVRVERLVAISEADAKAEGVDPCGLACSDEPYRDGFCILWDRINGERAAWDTNPWVWVVEFRKVEG